MVDLSHHADELVCFKQITHQIIPNTRYLPISDLVLWGKELKVLLKGTSFWKDNKLILP